MNVNLGQMQFGFIENLISIVFLLTLAAIFIWLFIRSLEQRSLGRSVTCNATLVSKHTEDYVSQPIFMADKQVNTGYVEKGSLYYVLFHTAQGRELSFPVSRQFYDSVSEGQEKQLTYKGGKLLQYGNLQNEENPQGADFKSLQEKL